MRHLALHAALVLSGGAALVYQISWTRMLHRVFGVGDLAVATVLASFFLGLGLGSWAASRFAARLKRPALAYAGVEVLIAAYAGISPYIVPSLGGLYVSAGGTDPLVLSLVRLAVALAVLLPPTMLMGVTLPIVARIVAGDAGWARGTTGLYVSNTLGAVLGGGLAGFWLIPIHGGRASTWIAALASLGAAAIVWAWHRRTVHLPASEEPSPSVTQPRSSAGALLAVSFACLTGASALAGEVLWTRLLRGVLHGTTQAFSAMLVNYLLGIAVGALLARRIAARVGPGWGLALTQVAAALLTVLAMVALPHLTRLLPLLQGEPVFASHDPFVVLTYSFMVLFPLALALGTGLPLAWSLAERVDPDAGRGTGRLLAANTLGGLAGSLLAALVLVPAMGIEAALLAVVFVHLVTAGLALRHTASARSPLLRSLALTAPIALGVAIVVAGPSVQLPFLLHAWRRPMEAIVAGPDPSYGANLVFVHEGRSATVTVARSPASLGLFNDGRPESGFSASRVGFGAELVALGGLPVFFGGQTRSALVVGLGAGHTTSVLLEGGFERVDVVELEEGIVDAARMMHEARSVPFPLDDPRAHLVIDDARNRLSLAPEGSYDAVVSQPSHPWLAGSSALYTRELFQEVDRALADDGVFALWVNLFRIRPRQIKAVVGTLQSVFPHVSAFIVDPSSIVLAASQRSLDWGPRLEERMGRLEQRYLVHHGLARRADLARAMELESAAIAAFARGAPRVVDDRPLLEAELAATPNSAIVRVDDLDRALRDVPWWPAGFARGWTEPEIVRAWLARVAHVTARPAALRRVEISLPLAGLSAPASSLVEGALAEARGDVRGALRAWDASGHPEAAARADALRVAEGMGGAALRQLPGRVETPTSSEPLLRAALRAGDARSLRTAIETAERVGRADEAELLAYTIETSARGCEAWSPRLEPLARRVYEVAFTAQRCAFAAGDLGAAERLGTIAVRARRAAALAAFTSAQGCRAGGNRGCALLMYRRAIREYPSHSASAAGLAELLHERGRRAEAREVLLRTFREVDGLPESQATLASTAARLGVDLGVDASPPPSSPSSTSTQVNEPLPPPRD